jgi:uncharacterized protein (UPF0332 family)
MAKANRLAAEAEKMLSAAFNDAASRTAYLAGLHAAQALIFERETRVSKTHRGVQTAFLRLIKDEARLDGPMRSFLSRAYHLKALADYETGPESEISAERATTAVREGKEFVARIGAILERP